MTIEDSNTFDLDVCQDDTDGVFRHQCRGFGTSQKKANWMPSLATPNQRIRTRAGVSVAALCLAIVASLSPQAQVDRAGLNGTVTDPAGRVLGGVHVVVIEDATSLRRETTSSANGIYAIPELPVGDYTILFTHQGFQELRITGVKQTIGRTRTLDVSLKVAGAEEKIDVAGSALDLNETSSSQGTLLEKEQVRDLPLNGRNWATLTSLVPGAIDTGGSNQRSIRFGGRGLDDNSIRTGRAGH